jgi:hypothetical protein
MRWVIDEGYVPTEIEKKSLCYARKEILKRYLLFSGFSEVKLWLILQFGFNPKKV